MAFLTRRFGWRLVLTINFDDLIERALSSEGLDPIVYDVWRSAELPAEGLVRKGLSVVKLHGSAYGLRVGESLDVPLKNSEKDRLCAYMGHRPVLLIAGWSGQDQRIKDLVEVVVERGGELVWVYFEPAGTPTLANKEEWKSKVLFVPTYDAGAFLGELYARVTGTHPISKEGYAAHSQRPLGARVRPSLDNPSNPDLSKPVQLFTEEAGSGVAGCGPIRMSAFASMLSKTHRTIWVDVGTFQSVEELVVDILRQCRTYDSDLPSVVLALQRDEGDYGAKEARQPEKGTIRDSRSVPATGTASADKDSELDKAVSRIHEALRRGPYVLALDEIGGFGRPPTSHHGIPGGRAEDVRVRIEELQRFVNRLVDKADECKDAYICLSITSPRARFGTRMDGPSPFQGEIHSLISELAEHRFVCHHSMDAVGRSEQAGSEDWKPAEWDWTDLDALLCTFRRPRSIIALRKLTVGYLRWEFTKEDAWAQLDKLLEDLNSRNILLRTEGGFYWMPNSYRDPGYDKASTHATSNELLCFVGAKPEAFSIFDHNNSGGVRVGKELKEDQFRASLLSLARLTVQHRDIADYYYSDLFLASKDPGPLFESLYHQVASMRYATILEALFWKLDDVASRKLCQDSMTVGSRWEQNPVRNYLENCQKEGPRTFMHGQRLNIIRGLWHTLQREEDFLLSHVPSDTLLRWVRWVREKDFSCFALSYYGIADDSDTDVERVCATFQQRLLAEEAKILREKTDYPGCVQVRLRQVANLISIAANLGQGLPDGDGPEVQPAVADTAASLDSIISFIGKQMQRAHKAPQLNMPYRTVSEAVLDAIIDIGGCYTRLGRWEEAKTIAESVRGNWSGYWRKAVMRSHLIGAERSLFCLDGWGAKNDGLSEETKLKQCCQEAVKDCEQGLALVREATRDSENYFKHCCYFRTHKARANALLGNYREAFQEFDRAVVGLNPDFGSHRAALAVCTLHLADALMLRSDRLVIDACLSAVNGAFQECTSVAGRLFLRAGDDTNDGDFFRRLVTPWANESGTLDDAKIAKADAVLAALTEVRMSPPLADRAHLESLVQGAQTPLTENDQVLPVLRRSLAYWHAGKLYEIAPLVEPALGQASQYLTRAGVALDEAQRLLGRGRRNIHSWYLLNRLRAQLQFEWMLGIISRRPAPTNPLREGIAAAPQAHPIKVSTYQQPTPALTEAAGSAHFLEITKAGLRAVRDAFDNIFTGNGVSLRFQLPLKILWSQMLIAYLCYEAGGEEREFSALWQRWKRLNRWVGLSFFIDESGSRSKNADPYYDYFHTVYQSIRQDAPYSIAARGFVERQLKLFPNPMQVTAPAAARK